MHINKRRVRRIREGETVAGPVVYWMSRDQRAADNWALLYAQERAIEMRAPLIVLFCLAPQFLGATIRQYRFMIDGLKEVESALRKKRIPFQIFSGAPEDCIPAAVKRWRAGLLVTDFDPLRIKRAWKDGAAKRITIPFDEVDAHNIVPAWIASPKQEYGAHTLRPKILSQLPEFLVEIPVLKTHPIRSDISQSPVKWESLEAKFKIDVRVPPVTWLSPGERAARRAMRKFIAKRLAEYDATRNDPSLDGQSGLSPYLHFGQLSAQRLALSARRANVSARAKDVFLEELIVRRELSDNFCLYNGAYDSLEGFPHWAGETLAHHRRDPRPYRYSLKVLEEGKTHDALWNAAETEMVVTGKMHGYMRMYWAKKILEWSPTPEEALRRAIYLNDRYELDGRDPNGYTGIAWSIGGVHDRAWGEREVFGKVRFMSYTGCKGKFDIEAYIGKIDRIVKEAASYE